MATALIGIGSNLGDSQEVIRQALTAVAARDEISAIRSSRLYCTKPVGGPADQARYVNAAAVLETSLAPRKLLERLRDVEADLGRTRAQRWAPRTLDLDLLLFDEEIIQEPGLVVPHPRMSFRRFVLEPAAEVAPDMLYPISGRRIGELLAHLNEAPHYVAVGGLDRTARTWLAEALGRELGCPVIHQRTHNSARPVAQEPAVPSLTRALEFVKDGSGLLSHEYWRASARLRPLLARCQEGAPAGREQPPAVSSFWLDQWRLWACLYGPDADARPAAQKGYRQWMDSVGEQVGSAVTPKLVIWLDAVAALTPRMEERLSGCLQTLFRQAAGGVVLRLDDTDPERILAESVAAIEALEPLEGLVS